MRNQIRLLRTECQFVPKVGRIAKTSPEGIFWNIKVQGRGSKVGTKKLQLEKRSKNVNIFTASLAFLKALSISSSGFQTRGTPCSSYRNLSSKWFRSLLRKAWSAVCSSILTRRASQERFRRVAREMVFSSSVQLKPEIIY